MSYCRWSSMNFMCDVYVYEDCDGGWTTHVAGNRRAIPPIPTLPWPTLRGKTNAPAMGFIHDNWMDKLIDSIKLKLWHLSYRLHMLSLRPIPSRPIGLPCDGKSFNDPTPGDCADRLIALRDMGYNVPKHSIDALREEQNENNSTGE